MKTFALAGNPNCGKTTLFNVLTGSTAHVGNWPGVTVDKRDGVYKGGAEKVAIVDLPGIYSLSPYTPEEVISRNFILDEKPDGIINIVDATNLERNLYLTTQLLEMDVPVIIALNMMDEVEKVGDKIDVAKLEKEIGVPVVSISALKKVGIKELMDRAIAMSSQRKGTTILKGAFSEKIERARQFFVGIGVSSPLFHAIKMLESDEIELEHTGAKELLMEISAGSDLESDIADERYKYISSHFSSVKSKSEKQVMTKSDKIDKVLTHRIWAIPIFIVILFLVFHLTFSEDLFYLSYAGLPSLADLGLAAEVDGELVYNNFGVELLAVIYDGAIYSPGVILTNLLNLILDHITDGILTLMGNAGAADWALGLVGDGILGGIFAVLGFLPQILTLFLFFSIMEDTGYMARIAFVLDRIFRRFGLSGRAFMPMIMGFGCSVPAMINTRTLADDDERTATIRVIPFFSCGAKLPILVAVSGAICAMVGLSNVDLITYSMYLIGIITAIICVLLMRNTTMKGEIPPFIMELPAYHLPGFRNLMLHLWDKAKHFIKKAFTVIFATTVAIWLFTHLSWSWHYLEDEEINQSIFASLGMLVQPIFTPLGFGSQLGEFGWVFALAALSGLLAKENVISVFGVLAGCIAALGANIDGVVVSDALLQAAEGADSVAAMVSATGITVPALLAYIVFNMTTIPCFAAVATAKAEHPASRKFGWTIAFWLGASYIAGIVIYTIGSWWWTLFIWLVVAAVVVTLIVLNNKGKISFKKIFNRQKD
jgi:ferrous iron transport protein B